MFQEMAMIELTIVTAASSDHFSCLCNLLYTIHRFEPGSNIIVYDLGLSPWQAELRQQPRVNFRRFQFELFPAWMAVGRGMEKGDRAGCYAWKPVIISDCLNETSGALLWLDAGNIITSHLKRLRRVIETDQVYSPTSSGTIRNWTHQGTLT